MRSRSDTWGDFRPVGEPIGWLTTEDCVFLTPKNTFALAQRYHSSTLPPGSSHIAAFSSVWTEGLNHPAHPTPDKDRKVVKKLKVAGRDERGVPIHIDHLIGARATDGDEAADS